MEGRQEDPQLNDVAQPATLGTDNAAGADQRGGSTVLIQRRGLKTSQLLYMMGAPSWAIDAGCGLSTYDTAFQGDEARVEAIREAAKDARWIGVVGRSPGRGKTHLAIGAALDSWWHDLCDGGVLESRNSEKSVRIAKSRDPKTYRFVRADVLLQRLVMAGISYSDLHDEFAALHCLLLDEVGRNMTGQRADIFYALTGDIYDRGGQLIWTAPFSKAELPTVLDGAFLDRANEGLIIELPLGKSYRRSEKPAG